MCMFIFFIKFVLESEIPSHHIVWVGVYLQLFLGCLSLWLFLFRLLLNRVAALLWISGILLDLRKQRETELTYHLGSLRTCLVALLLSFSKEGSVVGALLDCCQ
jgi:hypothetical protein